MAEAFFNKYAKNAKAYSAGSAPANFDSLTIENFDFMITMGCKDACPITPKDKTIKWDIEYPKGHSVRKYKDIRDLIETKIKKLMKELEIDD